MQNLEESQGFFEKIKDKFKNFNNDFLKANYNKFIKNDEVIDTINKWKIPRNKPDTELENKLFNDFKSFLEKKYNKSLNEFDEKDLNVSNLELKDELNPKIWDGNELKQEIRLKLLKVTKMFLDSLDLPNLKYKDIVMTGSLTNKNYTDESDVDVHIIVDYDDINQDKDLLLDYFKLKKNEWGDKYHITLYGYPVEVFVQDDKQVRDWTSVYSLINNEWVQNVELKDKQKVDKEYIKKEALSMINDIENWEKEVKNPENYDKILSDIEKFMEKLRTMRSKGLEKGGEMDNDNLIFKLLRTGGFLDKISKIKETIINKELSLDEQNLLSEKIYNLNNDVDYLYNKYFKDFIEYVNNNDRINLNLLKPSEDSTLNLSSSEAIEANKTNPCKILINDQRYKTYSNFYKPSESIINLNINFNALSHALDYKNLNIAAEDLPYDQQNLFLKEFSETKIKSSIYHELAHWIDDSLNNKHIEKTLSKFKKIEDKEDVNLTDMEIQAQIHNIVQLKRSYKDNWDNLSLYELIRLSPTLNTIYNKYKKNNEKLNYWFTKLRKRMHRENLLGKNMVNNY